MLTLGCILLAAPLHPAAPQDLSGRWSGRIESRHLSAQLDLELARRGGGWTSALVLQAGADKSSPVVDELRVGTESVQVRTKIEGADVSIDLALDHELLLGSIRATENGRCLAEGTVGLARVGDAEAASKLTRWIEAQGDPIDSARRGAVIDRALELLIANYVFADRAQRAADELRRRAAAGEYDGVRSAARLAETIGRHLSEATGDRHLRVKYSSESVQDPRVADSESAEDLDRLRREAAAEGFGIGADRQPDGRIGYLELKRFCRAEFAGDALAAAMSRLASSDALIVDLRQCRGGDPVMVALVASWFFDGRPRHWNDLVRRCDGTTTQYWTAAWLPGPRFAEKPLYVLTAARTFSAPESLAYELQQTGRATIVGETTGGGAHSGAWFPIDRGFAIFVPLSQYVSAQSGGDWEGTGVVPDLPCEASIALDRALAAAKERLGVR